MPVQIYVNFNQQCEEAVTFYAGVFQTPAPNFMRFGAMPNPDYPLDDVSKNLIMHTELVIEEDTVMFSDVFPGMELKVGNNLSLTVVSDDTSRTRRYFDLLKVGGNIDMELQETFWSPLYGSIVDKYGVVWQFSTRKPA